jgi:molybdopterin synthase sulfur carrier subunit
MVRILLPVSLQMFAGVGREVCVEVQGAVTQRAVFDALEAQYPVLRGTLRDPVTLKRRPLVRLFACEEDVSHEEVDAALPEKVARGEEALVILGAIAGG